MSDDLDVLKEAARLLESGAGFVMATVIACKGSTPRNPGARMIWRGGGGGGGRGADGELVGTVGGGQFEHMVIDAARTHLKNGTGGIEHYVLGADADQCCGGTMDVFFEYHGARHRVVIFGAGHVALEIAVILRAAAVETVIVDDRPEWNSAERFASERRILSWAEGVRLAREQPASTLACVMTCSHDTDLELLCGLLVPGFAPGAGAGMPGFVGLIGSKSKRVCLFGRLVASGLSEEIVQRVHCPMGVGDTGKEPKLVAVSIAAQLLVEARKMAAL